MQRPWPHGKEGGAFFSTAAPVRQNQQPVGSFEGHVSRNFGNPRLWASLDGNFWIGGTASTNGILNPTTQQRSSRIGATAAVPLSELQSIKMSYSAGTYDRFGGNYQNVSVAWQYSWLGRP